MEQFQSRFPKAAMWLAINKPLFAQLMYAVPNECTDKVPTAATTGRKRMFNVEFMDGIPYTLQASVMVHEVLHDALLHNYRLGGRNPKVWNYACDIKINNLITAAGMPVGTGWLTHFKGNKFEGQTEEEIYDALMQGGEGGEGGSGDGDGGGGGLGPDDLQGGGQLTAEDAARTKGALQTATQLHGMGSLPQELREAIDAVLNPKEKWYEWLRKYFTSKQYSGCDWRAMCRREYMRSGMIAPPFQSDSLGTVVISVDQSGSISEEDLAYFAGHVNSIMLDCRPAKVVVQYFDTQVHEVDEFTTDDLPVELRRVCGGGTSFIDPCARAEEHEATVHIVLTDMYGNFPEGCEVPTIWASTSDITEAPFGDVVRIEKE